MKKRYYIRGIGIGVAVTVVLMHFSLSNSKQPMTDEEIRERASQLGMIEGTVLSEYENTTVSGNLSENTTTIVQTSTNPVETTELDNPTSEPQASELPISETPTIIPSEQTGDTILISVESGDSSYSVAKKLFEAGLVESAAEYDEFLCSNGFDKKISIGNHPIPCDATDWEIAELITSKQ